jgi:probable phosphoglycerate mutase
MNLKLYFLRHGETEYSKTGGYCGDIDPELTDEGRQMAEAFAASHKNDSWRAVYASPMKRTVATAKPICDAIGITAQLRDGLKEIRYGEWEGKTNEYVQEHYKDDYLRWLAEPAWNAPTGGETAVQIANRAMPVVYEIQEKHTDGNVLIVSHKATIRIILCSLMGIELGRYRDRVNALAGSISMVRFGAHGPLLETLGDRSYMNERLRALAGT